MYVYINLCLPFFRVFSGILVRNTNCKTVRIGNLQWKTIFLKFDICTRSKTILTTIMKKKTFLFKEGVMYFYFYISWILCCLFNISPSYIGKNYTIIYSKMCCFNFCILPVGGACVQTYVWPGYDRLRRNCLLPGKKYIFYSHMKCRSM